MALFTSVMPSSSGEGEQDIAALRAWACKLVSELRSLIYALDEQNVIKAREALKVAASGVEGVLSESQIPDIDISKVKGNRPYCIVEPGTDITTGFWIARDTDDGTELLAHIYYVIPDGDEGGNEQFIIQSSDVSDIVIAGGTTPFITLTKDGEIILNRNVSLGGDLSGSYIKLENGADIKGTLNVETLYVDGQRITGTVTTEG